MIGAGYAPGLGACGAPIGGAPARAPCGEGRAAGVVMGALRPVGEVSGVERAGGVSVCATRTEAGAWLGGRLVRERGSIDDDAGARIETGATSIALVTTRRMARSGKSPSGFARSISKGGSTGWPAMSRTTRTRGIE